MTKKKANSGKTPVHVAVIMDGNRRWAAERGLGPVDGHHQAAQKAIEPLIEEAIKLGIKYLTFWAWSTENWRRDQVEIRGIMKLFKNGLKENVERFQKMGVKLGYLGNLSRFSKSIRDRVLGLVENSKGNKAITVTFAINYGGRPEILRAVKKLVRDKISPKRIDEKLFASYLDTNGLPDPDLIIRTGGALRLSGFLPWQSVYSEFYFTPVLMPDFTPKEFNKAIASFQTRQRRFGGGKFSTYQKA